MTATATPAARLEAARQEEEEARRARGRRIGDRAYSARLPKTRIAERAELTREHVTNVLNGTSVGSAETLDLLDDIVRDLVVQNTAPTPPLDDGTDDDDLL